MAEGAGVEPARLIARRVSTALPSPVGWPFRVESHAGFAPAPRRFADAGLAARPVRHSGGMCRNRTGVAWVTARYPRRWTNIPTLVHLAGLEPARAPGLSRLPLPIGLQMRWSGRWASLPPPPAWRAGALLNELLPGFWWGGGLGARLRLAPKPPLNCKVE